MQSTMQDAPLLIRDILRHGQQVHGDSTVITIEEGGSRRATFNEVTTRAEKLAAALTRLGIAEGDRVGTFCWNNQGHLEAYLAIPAMGAVLHTLNIRLPAEQLAYVVNHAEDRCIIVDASLIPLLAAIKDDLKTVETIIVVGEGETSALGETLSYERLLGAEEPGFDWPDLDERSAAAMCYTSGTTGSPKGVVYSHRSIWLHTMAEQAASSVGMTEADRILIIVPMFHAMAWGTPYGAWLAGTDIIMPQMYLMGQSLAAIFNEHHPTLACGVPTIWNGLLALDTPIDFSTIRGITAGGAAVPETLIEAFEERFGATIIQGWGMTETSPLAAFGLPPARRLDGHDEMYYKIKAGRVVAGVEVRVVAEDGTILPNDGKSVGEFEIRGPWVTGSYYKDEDPAKFHDGWLCTGDVGTLDTQGYMTISDRTKDVIKSGGEWISSRTRSWPIPMSSRRPSSPSLIRSGPSARWWRSCPSPDGRPLRRTSSISWWTACRVGGCPTSGPSSTRSPRPASGSSTRRSCGSPTPTATTRCRARHCRSERVQRSHGRVGRAARCDSRRADRHGARRTAARLVG
jgi:fatty-acyl-CoA synthase